jgi:PTH1 family peptidyl-tRNA hydrolase
LVKLFVGLGNPGAKYAGNRHNIGFMALDRIAADHGFTPWRKAFQGLVSRRPPRGREGGASEARDLHEPLRPVGAGEALAFWKLPLADLTVFHDELDLAPGKLRLKQGGGHAGHNGLRSIHGHLGEAMPASALASATPATRTPSRPMSCTTSPRPIRTGWKTCSAASPTAPRPWPKATAQKFMNAVALRTAPPRSSTTSEKTKTQGLAPSTPADPIAEPDSRSAMQKLMDKFR